MREDCNCKFCKEKVNEYFCPKCFYNFNLCEVKKCYDGMVSCPKCNIFENLYELGIEKKMIENSTSNSEFFHFGLLPQICIHSLDEDEYSFMYKPQEKCDCDCIEWIESSMKIVADQFGYEFPKKRVHRCKSCNAVRISNHIGIEESNDV